MEEEIENKSIIRINKKGEITSYIIWEERDGLEILKQIELGRRLKKITSHLSSSSML